MQIKFLILLTSVLVIIYVVHGNIQDFILTEREHGVDRSKCSRDSIDNVPVCENNYEVDTDDYDDDIMYDSCSDDGYEMYDESLPDLSDIPEDLGGYCRLRKGTIKTNIDPKRLEEIVIILSQYPKLAAFLDRLARYEELKSQKCMEDSFDDMIFDSFM